MDQRKRIILFDVDGTLTKPRNPIEADFEVFLQEKVRSCCAIGLVGGSDFNKIKGQIHEDLLNRYDYVFAENGLIQFRKRVQLESQSIQQFLSEEVLQRFINFCLKYLSEVKVPKKRGNFVEFRTGMLNVSPVGRSCSQEEREEFYAYDQVHQVRQKMIDCLKKEFPAIGLQYSIGGQISFDVFPRGWDKTYCLQRLVEDGFEEIHFFGDKTLPGGNDFEIFQDSRTIGHSVKDPQDTQRQLKDLLFCD